MGDIAISRRFQIVELLSHHPSRVVTVRDLSRRLGVSEMTIRRDLDWLGDREMITRVHGGAIAFQERMEKPFGDRLKEFNPQKGAIARAAVQLVEDGDRIILDAGTTTRLIAIDLACKKNITVITNNLSAASELARCAQIETILLGGSLKHQELCTVGPLVKQGLADLSADTLFLSASGLSLQHGVTDLDLREVEVKQAMIAAAERVILVADSSKWGRRELARIAAFRQIYCLVSDDALPPEAISGLEAEGVQVITPGRMEPKVARLTGI